jgi:hypothetical protein
LGGPMMIQPVFEPHCIEFDVDIDNGMQAIVIT